MYEFHTLSFFCPFIFKNALGILKSGKHESMSHCSECKQY